MQWLTKEHDWRDARLASLLLQTIWGADGDVRRELETYRSELMAHLRAVERRFFSMLTTLDDTILAMERLEWRSHMRDLQLAFADVESQLRAPRRPAVYDQFDGLRRALRRHRRHEERLLALIALSDGPPAAAAAEAFL